MLTNAPQRRGGDLTAAAEGPRSGLDPPLFLADWTGVCFVHYQLDPGELQPRVPFELDLYDGNAYVSLVAFTQRRLRPRAGARLGELLLAPIANHPFLNVRTYVRHSGLPGIYFMCEWIPNRLAAVLGPPLYGLPYRPARLRYRYDRPAGTIHHQIKAGDALTFDAIVEQGAAPLRPAESGSLDHFLIERYVAFTCHRGRLKCFRVRHDPWPQQRIAVRMRQTDLLDRTGVPLARMTPVGANYSPGVNDVSLSAPHRVAVASPIHPEVRSPPARKLNSQCNGSLLFVGLALWCAALCAHFSGWKLMWLLALSLYGAGKCHTSWRERKLAWLYPARAMAYMTAWPGMDAGRFLDPTHHPSTPGGSEWATAIGKTLAGAALLWGVGRLLCPAHPLLVAWTGMLGIVLLLHFGIFDLLSLMWRATGIDAPPLMDRPLGATSLAGFWGRRWNTAFHALAHQLVFRPLSRHVSPTVALLASFLISGLIHDLVISVPAGAGLGLPTAYFVLQGIGALTERSSTGKRLGLGRGTPGRVFTIAFTAGPAFWLFHPPFVSRVVVPFLGAIGAAPHVR